MRNFKTIAFTTFAAWLTVAAAGCAPMTEAERDYRDFSRALYKAEYEAFAESCQAGGRLVFPYATGFDRAGTPDRTAVVICERRDSAIRFVPSDPAEYVAEHAAEQEAAGQTAALRERQ